MKPYVFDVCCDVCGGPAVATPQVAAAQYFGPVVHSDPAVCAVYLEQKKRDLERREKALEAKEKSI